MDGQPELQRNSLGLVNPPLLRKKSSRSSKKLDPEIQDDQDASLLQKRPTPSLLLKPKVQTGTDQQPFQRSSTRLSIKLNQQAHLLRDNKDGKEQDKPFFDPYYQNKSSSIGSIRSSCIGFNFNQEHQRQNDGSSFKLMNSNFGNANTGGKGMMNSLFPRNKSPLQSVNNKNSNGGERVVKQHKPLQLNLPNAAAGVGRNHNFMGGQFSKKNDFGSFKQPLGSIDFQNQTSFQKPLFNAHANKLQNQQAQPTSIPRLSRNNSKNKQKDASFISQFLKPNNSGFNKYVSNHSNNPLIDHTKDRLSAKLSQSQNSNSYNVRFNSGMPPQMPKKSFKEQLKINQSIINSDFSSILQTNLGQQFNNKDLPSYVKFDQFDKLSHNLLNKNLLNKKDALIPPLGKDRLMNLRSTNKTGNQMKDFAAFGTSQQPLSIPTQIKPSIAGGFHKFQPQTQLNSLQLVKRRSNSSQQKKMEAEKAGKFQQDGNAMGDNFKKFLVNNIQTGSVAEGQGKEPQDGPKVEHFSTNSFTMQKNGSSTGSKRQKISASQAKLVQQPQKKQNQFGGTSPQNSEPKESKLVESPLGMTKLKSQKQTSQSKEAISAQSASQKPSQKQQQAAKQPQPNKRNQKRIEKESQSSNLSSYSDKGTIKKRGRKREHWEMYVKHAQSKIDHFKQKLARAKENKIDVKERQRWRNVVSAQQSRLKKKFEVIFLHKLIKNKDQRLGDFLEVLESKLKDRPELVNRIITEISQVQVQQISHPTENIKIFQTDYQIQQKKMQDQEENFKIEDDNEAVGVESQDNSEHVVQFRKLFKEKFMTKDDDLTKFQHNDEKKSSECKEEFQYQEENYNKKKQAEQIKKKNSNAA